MLCPNCSKLVFLNTKRKCVRCQNEVLNNISVLCETCSNVDKICSVCLKKTNNPEMKKLSHGGCGSCHR